MPPKSTKTKEPEVKLDEKAQAQLDESNRLQQLAFDRGVVSKAKRVDINSTGSGLPARADGLDIVKKGNMRKNRYLLNISARISASTAGKMGTLSQLDTRNPVLYIDFPDGRLKFVGTLFFPKNKYMTLRFAQKEVLCEDIFESMIVFSEHHWIGTAEENPEELPMPLPSTLQQAEKAAPPTASQKAAVPATQPEPSQEQSDAGGRAPRASQRDVKRKKYNSSNSNADSSEEEDDDTGEAGSDSADDQPTGKSKKQSTLLNFLSQSQGNGTPSQSKTSGKKRKGETSSTAKRAKRQTVVSDDADSDLEIIEEEEVVGSQKRSQAPRTAKATPKKLVRIEEEGDDSDKEDSPDEIEDDSDFEA